MAAEDAVKAADAVFATAKRLCDRLDLADITDTSLDLSVAEVHIVAALIKDRLRDMTKGSKP
jgi:hypothetical protein